MAEEPAMQVRTAFKQSESDMLACHQAVNSVGKTLLPKKCPLCGSQGLATEPVM
ncbi:hypothetical protein THOM_0087 [Trachipleistophora hominis]|uniref:Uncharacterized protein n=1 Tax=Trachipleistophora hominis TaxID=72359 RepID=L7K0C3_TRAHO|nr:hypothetical protein THOM_0087 [Trachipleistophora hominis]